MATVGGHVSRDRSWICAWPFRPVLSLTAAVIVWVPIRRGALDTLAPVPRTPSRLDVHCSWLVRSPCSRSIAVPVSVTGALVKITA
jgi:hypothetical protein